MIRWFRSWLRRRRLRKEWARTVPPCHAFTVHE